MDGTVELDELDQLATRVYEGYVVRKELARQFKGRYPVPEYVAEFLLGRYCASTDENEIAEVAERSRKLSQEARETHVIFNNNNLDYAPRAALRLRKALDQIVRTPAQTPELF